MIRGRLLGVPGGVLRPFVLAQVAIPSHNIAGKVYFLLDTGADLTVLGPSDASRLKIDTTRRQRTALARIPSLLGRDLLSHFALFYEERANLVLLLEPNEAEAVRLHLP